MSAKRKVEVFTAGCPVCDETVKLVKSIACDSCEVEILDTNDGDAARRAKELGVNTVPAVAVDGVLLGCCAGRGPDEAALRAAGIGSE